MSLLHSPNILFVQKSGVIEQQKADVIAFLEENIPTAQIAFASHPGDVALGSEFDVVVSPTIEFLDDILSRVSGVKWIHFLSAGVEKIWSMDFNKEAYILTKSNGVHAETMSEFALGAILYFEKSFDRFVEQSRKREWKRFWLGELTGKKITVLGLGSIGSEIARKAKVFGMRTAGSVHSLRDIDGVDEVVTLNDIYVHLADSDFIVSCLPLTETTRGWVDEDLVRQFKPGSVFIDISRGGVVKEQAILAGLNSGVLRGAALDVFEKQPLPADSALWDQPNVLITPHVSGTTQNYLRNALAVFYSNFRCISSGQEAPSRVDISKGY